jgi:hypothetical protein
MRQNEHWFKKGKLREMKGILDIDNYGPVNISRQGREAIANLLKGIDDEPPKKITEDDVNDLPEVVQRYLRYSGVIGKPRYRLVRLSQEGEMFRRPGAKGLPLKAVEYYNADDPSFVWIGHLSFAPLVTAKAIDSYCNGKGRMFVRVMSLVKMFDESGPEMDQASLTRFLNEMTWFPTAFLNDYITWEQIDANRAMVKIDIHGLKTSAEMVFDVQGRMLDFITKRHMLEKGDSVLRRWNTPMTKYGTVADMNLPIEGNAVWTLESGEYTYMRARAIDIQYDPHIQKGRA